MSGLGDRKKLFYHEVDMRYTYMVELTHSHALLSFGISCFSPKKQVNEDSSSGNSEYSVQTFDVLLLCERAYMVEAASLKFLRSHGYDFNKQCDHGLPYHPGNDQQTVADKNEGCSDDTNTPLTARSIFSALVRAEKPIVLHNGLIDLIFLYQHLYAQLPKNIDTFAANLYDLFPIGIYDTKYFSEFVNRVPATYLQYVYLHQLLKNEGLREQQQSGGGGDDGNSIQVEFPASRTPVTADLQWFRLYLPSMGVTTTSVEKKVHEDKRDICTSYGYHGWCDQGNACSHSHDVKRIVLELAMTGSGKQQVSHYHKQSVGTIDMLKSHLRSHEHKASMGRGSSNRSRGSSYNIGGFANNIKCSLNTSENTTNNTGEFLNYTGNSSKNTITTEHNIENTLASKSSTRINMQVGNRTDDRRIVNINTQDCQRVQSDSLKITSDDTTRRNADNSSHFNFEGGALVNVNANINDKHPEKNVGSCNGVMNGHKRPRCSSDDSNGCSPTVARIRKESHPAVAYTEVSNNDCASTSTTATCRGHTAGVDAYMTGFIFASYIVLPETRIGIPARYTAKALHLEEHVNKVYLMSKDFPFLVRRATFSKLSKNHIEKLKSIRAST